MTIVAVSAAWPCRPTVANGDAAVVQGITVIALGLATAGDALLSGSMVHAIKKSRAGKELVSLERQIHR